MGLLTSQQITRFYDLYRDTEIVFSKEIIKTLHLDPRQIYIKCNKGQWPCIINSSSLLASRIIIGTRGGAYAAIQKPNTPVSLRFFFTDQNGESMSFFVNAHVSGIENYMNSRDLAIATLTFNSKPPDDLIEIIGRILETNTNFIRRKEERIAITPESKRRLSLLREETVLLVQNVPRNCIVRDLSFSGAKIIMMGVAQFLKDKQAVLQLEFEEPRETVTLNGTIIKAEPVEERKELVTLAIKFNDAEVPIAYKVHINNCLTAVRQKMLNSIAQQTQQSPGSQSKVVPMPTAATAPFSTAPISAPTGNASPAQNVLNAAGTNG
ncbi:PilZ domain-containing protein [Treponema lecithinolyticum]|uniref:PilZ domain-containing protein n=1 Tax=Treponema lecithinolyticum TaxID=53418 RepID=UPI0028EAAFD7|nr:PilZ domain-containing protein [Treponema lecithinolyticum]